MAQLPPHRSPCRREGAGRVTLEEARQRLEQAGALVLQLRAAAVLGGEPELELQPVGPEESKPVGLPDIALERAADGVVAAASRTRSARCRCWAASPLPSSRRGDAGAGLEIEVFHQQPGRARRRRRDRAARGTRTAPAARSSRRPSNSAANIAAQSGSLSFRNSGSPTRVAIRQQVLILPPPIRWACPKSSMTPAVRAIACCKSWVRLVMDAGGPALVDGNVDAEAREYQVRSRQYPGRRR